jgi:hypothetical protein
MTYQFRLRKEPVEFCSELDKVEESLTTEWYRYTAKTPVHLPYTRPNSNTDQESC